MKTSAERRDRMEERVEKLIAAYGEGEGLPSRAQWQALAGLPEEAPVTLLNFFKFRAEARYGTGSGGR